MSEGVPVERSGRGWRRLALDGWPLLLAVMLFAPLLTRPGWPLARDLMFVPRQRWTSADFGLSDVAPRAVPLDALVSGVAALVDGGVVARVVLPLVLATAGWGAHRLVGGASTGARLAVAGFAVWNPFVVERLALGQWALLTAYAALPWLVPAVDRFRRLGRPRDLASVALWGAASAVSPTGGLFALAALGVIGWGHPRRWVMLLAAGVVLQLPWVVPAVTGPAGVGSDPDGVAAFAARADGPGGVWVALLGLGGIWDKHSVPGTRATLLATATAVLVVLVVALGVRLLPTLLGVRVTSRLLVLAGAGLLLAVTSSVPPGAELMRWVVTELPGGGLLRDAQKFLAPLVLLVAVCLGAVADAVLARVRSAGREASSSVALALVAAPLVLLPDGASTVWRTIDPVVYPNGFERVADLLGPGSKPGALVTLPWRSYRGFSWGNGLVSADPAGRWFGREVLASGDLRVGDLVVAGEDPTARRLGEALASRRPADVLGAYGVAWALVYSDDPDAAALDLTGLGQVYSDAELALYAVPEPVRAAAPVSATRKLLVVVGDSLALVLVLAAALVRMRRRARSGRTNERRVKRRG